SAWARRCWRTRHRTWRHPPESQAWSPAPCLAVYTALTRRASWSRNCQAKPLSTLKNDNFSAVELGRQHDRGGGAFDAVQFADGIDQFVHVGDRIGGGEGHQVEGAADGLEYANLGQFAHFAFDLAGVLGLDRDHDVSVHGAAFTGFREAHRVAGDHFGA